MATTPRSGWTMPLRSGIGRRAAAAAAGTALLACANAAVPPPPVAAPTEIRTPAEAALLPLTATPGDAERGRRIVADRSIGLCLLCHRGPFPDQTQGTLAPDLAGAGSRGTEGQLRLRLVDARRLNPATIMPPYGRADGLVRVAPAWRDRPLLSDQQIEDVVAFLLTLRDNGSGRP
jgi:sulfur-oxidizing protein SoxX